MEFSLGESMGFIYLSNLGGFGWPEWSLLSESHGLRESII
jgi:hypothetical protein